MEAATLTLDNRIYDKARHYARRHRTSVEQLFSHFVLTLVSEDEEETAGSSQSPHVKPLNQLSPQLQALVGIARRNDAIPAQDINASDIKEQYFLEKYGE